MRDLARLPPLLRQASSVRSLLDAPHDDACVQATLDELLAAMLAQAPFGPPANQPRLTSGSGRR